MRADTSLISQWERAIRKCNYKTVQSSISFNQERLSSNPHLRLKTSIISLYCQLKTLLRSFPESASKSLKACFNLCQSLYRLHQQIQLSTVVLHESTISLFFFIFVKSHLRLAELLRALDFDWKYILEIVEDPKWKWKSSSRWRLIELQIDLLRLFDSASNSSSKQICKKLNSLLAKVELWLNIIYYRTARRQLSQTKRLKKLVIRLIQISLSALDAMFFRESSESNLRQVLSTAKARYELSQKLLSPHQSKSNLQIYRKLYLMFAKTLLQQNQLLGIYVKFCRIPPLSSSQRSESLKVIPWPGGPLQNYVMPYYKQIVSQSPNSPVATLDSIKTLQRQSAVTCLLNRPPISLNIANKYLKLPVRKPFARHRPIKKKTEERQLTQFELEIKQFQLNLRSWSMKGQDWSSRDNKLLRRSSVQNKTGNSKTKEQSGKKLWREVVLKNQQIFPLRNFRLKTKQSNQESPTAKKRLSSSKSIKQASSAFSFEKSCKQIKLHLQLNNQQRQRLERQLSPKIKKKRINSIRVSQKCRELLNSIGSQPEQEKREVQIDDLVHQIISKVKQT